MSDWAAGDLALCISDQWVNAKGHCATRPRKGWIGKVVNIGLARGVTILVFAEFGLKSGFSSSAFIKVTPPDEMEGDELEELILSAAPNYWQTVGDALHRQNREGG